MWGGKGVAYLITSAQEFNCEAPAHLGADNSPRAKDPAAVPWGLGVHASTYSQRDAFCAKARVFQTMAVLMPFGVQQFNQTSGKQGLSLSYFFSPFPVLNEADGRG